MHDVVFASDYAGAIYGSTRRLAEGRAAQAPAGVNAFPTIDGDTLLVGAGAPGFFNKPQYQLIAYSLTTSSDSTSSTKAAR